MRRMAVGSLLVLLACGGKSSATEGGGSSSGSSSSAAVKDEGFSRACATDDDCVLAQFGDTCGICSGSNAAIAKSAQASWQQAYNAARANCRPDHVVGKCAPNYGIAHCDPSKSCTFVACNDRPADEHHCASPDGGH